VKHSSLIPVERIEKAIYLIRGEKVMLDRDLAALYEVETRVLNQAVGRNRERFPPDFMFELTREEITGISQIVTSSNLKFSKRVSVFTEQGVGVQLIDCDHRTPPAAEAGYPYVAIPQIKNGRINLSDARRITRQHFLEWTRKAHPQAFDVVLSRRCNPGETACVPSGAEFALGQNLVCLRAKSPRVYPPFLRWLVRGGDWWEQVGTFINVGAVFDSLRCADIPNFELTIPPSYKSLHSFFITPSP
jgi:ORF6N domain